MPVFEGRLAATGRVGIVVSRYNEVITGRLLDGALECCKAAGLGDAAVDVVWVPGAFELPVAAAALAASGKYRALVAIGAVIRGDTPHFEFVAGETTRGIGAIALEYKLPVAFGVLTVDTFAQASDRAGGSAGNKGYEAAEAAIRTADALAQWSGA